MCFFNDSVLWSKRMLLSFTHIVAYWRVWFLILWHKTKLCRFQLRDLNLSFRCQPYFLSCLQFLWKTCHFLTWLFQDKSISVTLQKWGFVLKTLPQKKMCCFFEKELHLFCSFCTINNALILPDIKLGRTRTQPFWFLCATNFNKGQRWCLQNKRWSQIGSFICNL